jgi:PBSX family phage terminase large subunit
VPLTEKQQDYLLNCSHRWNVKTGASGSGKRFVDFAVTIPKRINACRGEGLIVLMGNTRGTLERNILEPMRSIWPGCVGEIRSDNTVTLFGKKVYALGADNKKHVARIQGATFEYVYGDEITTWSRDVFEMLKSRLRCQHSHFDGTCNPDSPGHWFKAFLESDADIFQQSYVIDDGVLPEHIVEELKKEYAGTIYYDRYILGLWTAATGIIYPMFREAIAEPPADQEAGEYCLSIDYGTQNAFAALLWARYGAVWYAVREYYYSGRDTGVQKTDEEYAQDLDKWLSDLTQYNDYMKLPTIIDPSAASFIALLRKRGRYKVLQADNAVADGIRETATAMQTGKLKIVPSLKNWRKEAEGYVWDDKAGEDKPVKVNDHLMDSTRYFCKTRHIARPERSNHTPIWGLR